MNRRGQDFSQLAASIDDLKIKLYSWFFSSEVRVCRRNANKVAHMLAFVGKSCNNVVFLLKKIILSKLNKRFNSMVCASKHDFELGATL
jgi:hypothetical protein